jgi:hypothetical protein
MQFNPNNKKKKKKKKKGRKAKPSSSTYIDLVAGSGGPASAQDGGRSAFDCDNERGIVC